MANIRYNVITREFAWVSQTNLDRSVIPSNRCLTSSQADLIYVRLIDYNEDMINIFDAFNDIKLINIFSKNNNIGINNSDPSYNLDVNGNINFTGQLYKDDTILDLNALSYWNSSNDNVYRIDGNVGIGESILDAKLHVESPANLKAGLFTQGGADSNVSILSIIDTGDSVREDVDSSMFIIKKNHNGNSRRYISISDNNTRYLELLGNGNLGVGVGNPQYKLDVNGDVNITGDYYRNGELFDNYWTRLPNNKLIYNNGNVGIGIDNPNYKLDVFGDIHLTGRLLVNNINVLFLWTTDGTNVYNNEANTNIGIGTNNPSYKLSVVDGGDTTTDYKLWVGRDESNKGFGVSLDDFGSYLTFKQTSVDQHYAIFNLDSVSAHDHYYDFRINGVTKVRLGNTSNIDNITINSNKLSSSTTDLLINNGNTSVKNFKIYDGQTTELFTLLNSGNVGIGVTNPSFKLEVNGSINLTAGNSFRINGIPVATVGQTKWSDNSEGIDYSETDKNVGIQTNSPQDELHVDGTIRAGTNTNYLQITNSSVLSNGLVTMGTQTNPTTFIGLSTISTGLSLGNTSTPELSIDTNNTRVGVNRVTPLYTLDVNGDIRYNGDTRTKNTIRKESATVNIANAGWYTIVTNSGENGRTFMNIKLTSDGGLHEPFILEFEVFKSWSGSNTNNFIKILNYSGAGSADTVIDKIRLFYDSINESVKVNINAIATLEFELIVTEYLNRDFTLSSGNLTADSNNNYLIEADVNSLSLTTATNVQNQNNSSYKISNTGEVGFKSLYINNDTRSFARTGNALEIKGGDLVFNRDNNTLFRFIHGASNSSKTGNFIRTDGLGRLIFGYNTTGQLADDSDVVNVNTLGLEMGSITSNSDYQYIVRRNINSVGYSGLFGIGSYSSRTGVLLRSGTATNLLLDNSGNAYLNNNKIAVENTSNLSNYYTKANLQTSGDAQVHWSNLTNIPTNISNDSYVTAASITNGVLSLTRNMSLAPVTTNLYTALDSRYRNSLNTLQTVTDNGNSSTNDIIINSQSSGTKGLRIVENTTNNDGFYINYNAVNNIFSVKARENNTEHTVFSVQRSSAPSIRFELTPNVAGNAIWHAGNFAGTLQAVTDNGNSTNNTLTINSGTSNNGLLINSTKNNSLSGTHTYLLTNIFNNRICSQIETREVESNGTVRSSSLYHTSDNRLFINNTSNEVWHSGNFAGTLQAVTDKGTVTSNTLFLQGTGGVNNDLHAGFLIRRNSNSTANWFGSSGAAKFLMTQGGTFSKISTSIEFNFGANPFITIGGNTVLHTGNQPRVRFIGTVNASGTLTKTYGDITVTYSNGTFTHNLNTSNYKISLDKISGSRDIPYIQSQDNNSCTIFKQNMDSSSTISNANSIEIEIKTF